MAECRYDPLLAQQVQQRGVPDFASPARPPAEAARTAAGVPASLAAGATGTSAAGAADTVSAAAALDAASYPDGLPGGERRAGGGAAPGSAPGGCWLVLLDAAKAAATRPPDLTAAPADFVVCRQALMSTLVFVLSSEIVLRHAPLKSAPWKCDHSHSVQVTPYCLSSVSSSVELKMRGRCAACARPSFPGSTQVLSFYKIFGYPTGLGALVARKDALALLRPRYFGGGTAAACAVDEDFFRCACAVVGPLLLGEEALGSHAVLVDSRVYGIWGIPRVNPTLIPAKTRWPCCARATSAAASPQPARSTRTSSGGRVP